MTSLVCFVAFLIIIASADNENGKTLQQTKWRQQQNCGVTQRLLFPFCMGPSAGPWASAHFARAQGCLWPVVRHRRKLSSRREGDKTLYADFFVPWCFIAYRTLCNSDTSDPRHFCSLLTQKRATKVPGHFSPRTMGPICLGTLRTWD